MINGSYWLKLGVIMPQAYLKKKYSRVDRSISYFIDSHYLWWVGHTLNTVCEEEEFTWPSQCAIVYLLQITINYIYTYTCVLNRNRDSINHYLLYNNYALGLISSSSKPVGLHHIHDACGQCSGSHEVPEAMFCALCCCSCLVWSLSILYRLWLTC